MVADRVSPFRGMVFHRTKGIISHLELEGGEGWDGGFLSLIMNLEHPSPVCAHLGTQEGAARSLFNFTSVNINSYK